MIQNPIILMKPLAFVKPLALVTSLGFGLATTAVAAEPAAPSEKEAAETAQSGSVEMAGSSVFDAKQAQYASGEFPSYPETEYEQSIITIPIYAGTDAGKENADPVEILKLTAFMRLEREVPTRNGLGHRQIEFTIADWELYGYSQYLDADVTFKLADMPVQPKSLVVSLTEKSDYPAIIVYNAVYDIYIGQKMVAERRPGVAFAKNVYEIPPRNISVAFTKPLAFSATDLSTTATGMDAARLATEGDIFFDDGTCEDMVPITREEFEQGVAIAQSIRAGELTLQ